MKPFHFVFILTLCVLQTACLGSRDFVSGIGTSDYVELEQARGGGVSACGWENTILSKEGGYRYLEEYGLPKEIEGNFICDGDTPKLPKDCQGREFRSLKELEVYWEKYQLPRGILHFKCTNGIPSIRPESIEWFKMREAQMATCKDAQGKPRRCV